MRSLIRVFVARLWKMGSFFPAFLTFVSWASLSWYQMSAQPNRQSLLLIEETACFLPFSVTKETVEIYKGFAKKKKQKKTKRILLKQSETEWNVWYMHLSYHSMLKFQQATFLNIFPIFLPENRNWHFMQIVSNTDNLHEMSNPVICEKWKEYHQFIVFWISPESGKR